MPVQAGGALGKLQRCSAAQACAPPPPPNNATVLRIPAQYWEVHSNQLDIAVTPSSNKAGLPACNRLRRAWHGAGAAQAAADCLQAAPRAAASATTTQQLLPTPSCPCSPALRPTPAGLYLVGGARRAEGHAAGGCGLRRGRSEGRAGQGRAQRGCGGGGQVCRLAAAHAHTHTPHRMPPFPPQSSKSNDIFGLNVLVFDPKQSMLVTGAGASSCQSGGRRQQRGGACRRVGSGRWPGQGCRQSM